MDEKTESDVESKKIEGCNDCVLRECKTSISLECTSQFRKIGYFSFTAIFSPIHHGSKSVIVGTMNTVLLVVPTTVMTSILIQNIR